MVKKERESAFELLRILAQFMIIFYHILYFAIYPISEVSFYKAIWFPLHIGVPLFVFISGYFGIKCTVKGFVRLAGMVFILQMPYMINTLISGGGGGDLLKLPFSLSYTPFWFIRTYLFLYLLAPVINKYLKDISTQHRIYLLVVLLYMSIYIGTLGADLSLRDGKNVVTFLLYYTIGNTLYTYRHKWEKIDTYWLLAIFFFFNILVVFGFTYMGYGRYSNVVWKRLFFAYCSPMLLLNAILFFIIIGKLKFKSLFVNNVGKASLAMYMIHGTFLFSIINPIVLNLYKVNSSISFTLMSVTLVTLCTVLLCALIYGILNPVWNVVEKLGEYIQRKIDFLNNNFISNNF